VDHLRKHGFTVDDRESADVTAIKRQLGVPPKLSSCHTAQVDGYVIEGHVPADVIDKLLKDRPKIVGLAVPGMPAGSPGMETPGQKPQPYDVIAFDAKGATSVYAKR
jgi:hypothetical protein